MNDICFELSSSWRSDFDTTPIKLQRIRDRQRLPPLFLRKLRGEVRGIVGQVANAYRSKHMCALSRPAVIQTCLSSSATPILIRPEELILFHLLNWQERPRRGKKSNRELELDYLLWGLSSAILLHCG